MPPNLCIENLLLVEGLKHNFLSISQLCNKDFNITFDKTHYSITSQNQTISIRKRLKNVYMLDSFNSKNTSTICLVTVSDNS